jgi:hypothetical protein
MPIATPAVGPFHGMIEPTTPTGWRSWDTANSRGAGGMLPDSLVGQPE